MKPHPFVFSVLAVMFAVPSLPAAEPDAVEELQQALRVPIKDSTNRAELQFRRMTLEKRSKALTGIDAMHRALSLQEWRDDDRDENIAVVDRSIRDALAERFVTALRTTMKKGSAVRKQAAATLIGDIGTNIRASGSRSGLMRDLGPDLIALFADDDAAVREAAARALGGINAEAKPAGAALGRLLGHKDAATRRAAAEGLAELLRTTLELTKANHGTGCEVSRDDIFQACAAVVPAVARGLGEDDVPTRRSCLEAVQMAAVLLGDNTMDPLPAGTFPPPGLKPREDEVREMEAMRKTVEDERQATVALAGSLNQQVPAVMRALDAAELSVCEMAARGLESMAEARTRMKRRAASVPALVKKGPTDSLEEDPLRPGLMSAVPALAKLLTHKEVRGRLAALYALETLEADAAAAGDAAVRALADDNPFVRWGAARVLSRLPAPPDKAVDALAKALDDENGDVRVTAAAVLERYGAAAKAATAALGRAVGHKDPSMRVPAIKALAALGPAGKDAAPALTTALADPEAEVRQAAARALGKLGTSDAATVAALRKALRDPDAEVRRAASGALLGAEEK